MVPEGEFPLPKVVVFPFCELCQYHNTDPEGPLFLLIVPTPEQPLPTVKVVDGVEGGLNNCTVIEVVDGELQQLPLKAAMR